MDISRGRMTTSINNPRLHTLAVALLGIWAAPGLEPSALAQDAKAGVPPAFRLAIIELEKQRKINDL